MVMPNGASQHGTPIDGLALAYQVRLMKHSDIPTVVSWHAETFPSSFYSQLGPGFLRRWFASHMSAPASVSLVVSDPVGQIVGYLLGTTDQSDFRQRQWHEGFITGFRGTCALLARPSLWRPFLQLRARPYAGRVIRRIQRSGKSDTTGQGEGQLIYICMSPHHRHRGAGGVLLEAFVDEARRSGSHVLTLVTEKGNIQAQRFYFRYGWIIDPQPARAMDGRALTRMKLNLGRTRFDG